MCLDGKNENASFLSAIPPKSSLKIERSLVTAAHALDKRDRKTVSAFEVGTPGYSNLSQLSKGSPFAKRTCLTEACPKCIALVL